MKTRVEETIAKHSKGYNCAQAVACTYCDLVGLDEETMFKITEALGAGMGNMEGTLRGRFCRMRSRRAEEQHRQPGCA